MRVALLCALAPDSDAIGNQLAEKVAFFSDHGADVRVFLESDQRLHSALRPFCEVIAPPQQDSACPEFLSSADLLIVDYSQHYALLDWLPLLAGGRARIVFDYHGVTPTALWGNHQREQLQRGAEQRGLVWFAEAALAHSRFAAGELLPSTGFPADRLRQLPYAIDIQGLQTEPVVSALRCRLRLERATILLFVGRLAPNKRIGVLVEALAQLRELVPPVHAVLIGDTGDIYADEAERCQRRAAALGVADRLHILGQVDGEGLRDAYHSADVFVMPSRHEGFCLPVFEAMACSLPVIAARAAALPEAVGSAGLTFRPDDAADLARQVRRVIVDDRESKSADAGFIIEGDHLLSDPEISLAESDSPEKRCKGSGLRVAIVACRYGTDIVGGAETSLRTIAESLQQAGHQVEVFATCVKAEGDWSNHAQAGTSVTNGVTIHRFPIDARNASQFQAAQQRIADGAAVSAEIEHDYLRHSIRSQALLDALRGRASDWDAVIAGPYLFGLTFDVAREFADKLLLLPCFHNEPAARLPLLLDAYRHVGGVLYHSSEEQRFAEIELGLNHPRAACIGTVVDIEKAGNPLRGEELVGSGRRYVLYAGRYSPHKNLPLLLKYARRYVSRHPDRFVFAFVGQGDLDLPDEPWLKDLGFVSETTRRDLIAGAEAVVQLSRLESLSLVALEAWAQGVPVIVDRDCDVLAAQVRRCRGGGEVASYEGFALALNDVWKNPERWHELGRQGQQHVREHYGCRPTFVARLVAAVHSLQTPLRERMRQLGPPRAEICSRSRWRERFRQIVEEVLHALPRPTRERAEVLPRGESRTASAGSGAVLLPVQVSNGGSHPLVPSGPGRTVLHWRMLDEAGEALDAGSRTTPLPALVLPGQTVPAAITVPVPDKPGVYQISCWASQEIAGGGEASARETSGIGCTLRLNVEPADSTQAKQSATALISALQVALAQAAQFQRLPDHYTDISEGWLARWKRLLKSKLLNNFKRAYVDVLSRQQSAFNEQVLRMLQEIGDYCATLEHAVENCGSRISEAGLVEELAAQKQRCVELEERLARLERLLLAKEKLGS